MDLSKLSTEDLLALKSGDLSKVSTEGLMALKGETAPQSAKEEPGMLRNIGIGALKGAASIGATLKAPLDWAEDRMRQAMTDEQVPSTNDARRQAIGQFAQENADPESLAFKGGEIGTQIAGTAGVGGVLGSALKTIPAAAKFAPLVESGGFNLGNAGTNSRLANALLRTGGGAVQGGAQAALINPEQAGAGTAIGAATPLAVRGAGLVGDALSRGLETGSKKLMQSALKPTIEQLRTGKAQTAVDTLLDEGLNATRGGVDKLKGRIAAINAEVGQRITDSTATVDKQKVIDALKDPVQRFISQVNPTSDLAAIKAVGDDFASHPLAPGDDIPVQLAQALKQGTYKVLSKKYGQVGTAETEAQKALARGLKDEISKAVPEVAGLNAREARLITTLGVAERRALMDANKNPMGLAILAQNPASWAAFMADKSALFKSLAARMANSAAQANPVRKQLPNFVEQHGLLGAPSVVTTSSP